MARWRLTASHYLNVPGTEWEQKETDRETGRQARKVYYVPLHLDPDNPADQNYPNDGVVIVCHEGKGMPRDIVFVGPPTPDMEPLDEEAKDISKAESSKWIHPIESLDQSYGEGLIRQFERTMTEMLARQGPVSAQQLPDVTALLKQVEELSAKVAVLSVQAATKEEPLAEIEPTAEEFAAAEQQAKRRV